MTRTSVLASVLLFGAVSTACWAEDPVTWGPTADAKGCVILREYEKLDVVNSADGTGTTAKSHFELAVVASEGYTLPRATWPDDQATMNELQSIAIKDHTRFVKLNDHFSAQELAAAHSLCRQAMAGSP